MIDTPDMRDTPQMAGAPGMGANTTGMGANATDRGGNATDGGATAQLKAAGIDTDRLASRAGELTQMLKDEVAARPFQAMMVAAFLGYVYGSRR